MGMYVIKNALLELPLQVFTLAEVQLPVGHKIIQKPIKLNFIRLGGVWVNEDPTVF